jgi:DNA-binding transcriptional LysR family regulator
VNAERVCSREVDIGFVYPPVDLADELCSSVLTHERVVVAMPSGHPLARRATMRTAELADLPLVQCPPARTTGLWESMLAAVYGIDRPPTVTRVEPDEPHMLAAVAERAGIGLLTEAAARILNVPGVITRPFDASVTVPLGVIWRRDNANPAVRLYLGLARDLERLEDGIMLRYVEPAVRTGA